MKGKSALLRNVSLALLAVVAWGCGGSQGKYEMGKVRGKVTYKGAPVTMGTVSFFPVQGKVAGGDQTAIGEIGSDGSFELTTFDTGDGAIVGQHKAVVISRPPDAVIMADGSIPSQLPEDVKRRQGPKGGGVATPAKYADAGKTPLKYTVNKGNNEFAIELKD